MEQDVETVMVVAVRSYGRPDKMRRDNLLAVHRALHHSLGDDYSLSVDGVEIAYDADAGHHVALSIDSNRNGSPPSA